MNEEITSDAVKSFFRGDRFAEFVGVEILEAENGRAKARLPIRECHGNSRGFVHGGAVFTLADQAFAAAVHSRGQLAMGIHCSISYVKGVQEGVLLAEANEVSCGSMIALYTVRVTDSTGETVAQFEGMAYRKRERWTI